MADRMERRTPAAEVVALVHRIQHAPTRAQLVAIRDEVSRLAVGDLDAEMLHLGIASRERALRAGTVPDRSTPTAKQTGPAPGETNIRKLILSRAAPIKPVVSHSPRRVQVQRRTVVLVG